MTRDPDVLLEWAQRELSNAAIRRIDEAASSLDGYDRELADRLQYG